MLRLTNERLLVRVVDAAEEIIETSLTIYNFPFSQIILCEAGEGFIVSDNGVERSFGEGDMLFIDEGLHCGIRTDGSPVRIKKIACDTSMTPYLMNYFDAGQLHILKNSSDEIMRQYTTLFSQCGDAAASENKNTSLKLYRVIIMLGQEIAEKNDSESGVLRAMAKRYEEYIFANFKAYEKIDAPAEVEALFQRLYKMSVNEYNVYTRYERSKPFVCFKRNFAEVAKHLGFADEDEFVNGFTKLYKMMPLEYMRLFL